MKYKLDKAAHYLLLIYLVSNTGNLVKCAPEQPNSSHFNANQAIKEADQMLQPSDDYQASPPRSPFMQLRKLSSTSNNITCNDGSQVGYYERLNNHSKSWVIYLQGGGFCGGHDSCQQRWARSPQLMSSKYWPKTKRVEGILSNEPKENPHLWNANHIYVPYCSSDSWSGHSPFDSTDQQRASPFAFMGSKILELVLESLYDDQQRNSSLWAAKYVLLAGDSAGATGVILNLDKVAAFIEQRSTISSSSTFVNGNNTMSDQYEPKQAPVVRGLADSGWFLDNEPYEYAKHEINFGEPGEPNNQAADDCDHSRCTPSQSIRQAMGLWQGQVPEACASNHLEEPWKCYFGYRAYQTLKTPLFVVQWLYDEAQLMVDNMARPDTSGQWNYVNKVMNEMRHSLENVTALFAPSCFSHSLITRRSWNQINIDGFKLPQLLNSWEEQSLLEASASAIRLNQMTKQAGNDAYAPNVGAAFDSADSSTRLELLPTLILGEDTRQQVELSGLLWRNNDTSSSSFINSPQAGIGTLLAKPSSNQPLHTDTLYPSRELPGIRQMAQVSQASHESQRNNLSLQKTATQNNNTNRPRNRKRRRNNQQQKSKQARQRTPPPSPMANLQQIELSSINNDLAQSQTPLQELLFDQSLASEQLFGRLNREQKGSSFGRLGRSTLVDDATLMLSNNMPEDNLAAAQAPSSSFSSSEYRPVLEHKWRWPTTDSHPRRSAASSSNSAAQVQGFKPRFKLIDSCGWPQCNKDCPIMDSDFNSAGFIQF